MDSWLVVKSIVSIKAEYPLLWASAATALGRLCRRVCASQHVQRRRQNIVPA